MEKNEGKKAEKKESEEQLGEKVLTKLAEKYDFSPHFVQDLQSHAHNLSELLSFLSSNQYYSEGLSQKVFSLKVDADLLLLKVEREALKASKVVHETEKAVLCKKEPLVQKQEVDETNSKLQEASKEADKLYERATLLIQEIRKEFEEKKRVF